jgi:MFS family permease
MTENTTRATGLLLALTLLNVLNWADRYLIISFSTAIIPELGLTNFQFGLLTGVVFTAVYTIIGLFMGSLADRVHRPKLIAAGLALWSGLTAATGLAKSFGQMAAARMLIGVGEACLSPAALSMLGERFPPARRAFAGGFYYLALPLGIGGSFMFAAAVGPTLGWRGGFIVLGGIGVAASLLVWLLMRDPSREQGREAGAVATRPKGSFRESFAAMLHELRNNPVFSLTMLGLTTMVFAQGANIMDLVWWVKERGYSPVEAQQQLGLIFLVGGITGAVIGGAGCDWAQQRYKAGRLKFLAWAFLITAPVALAYRLLPGHTALFYLMAFIASALSMLLYGPAVTLAQEQVPAQHRASAIALFFLAAALIGAGGGNAMVGWLADRFTAAGMNDPITWAILSCYSSGLLSVPILFLAARFQERSPAPEAAQSVT